eukprot:scaffold42878_cov36-Tisochrysis_lutea.AAC.1
MEVLRATAERTLPGLCASQVGREKFCDSRLSCFLQSGCAKMSSSLRLSSPLGLGVFTAPDRESSFPCVWSLFVLSATFAECVVRDGLGARGVCTVLCAIGGRRPSCTASPPWLWIAAASPLHRWRDAVRSARLRWTRVLIACSAPSIRCKSGRAVAHMHSPPPIVPEPS